MIGDPDALGAAIATLIAVLGPVAGGMVLCSVAPFGRAVDVLARAAKPVDPARVAA